MREDDSVAAKKGMRISELARRTGTSKETIHFYLREGLLERPEKTSRNMAYYGERHVAQLALIRKLRTESYLPLAAIKKLLDEGELGARARHLDLSGALFGRGAKAELEPLTREELAARAETSVAQLERYEARGLIRAVETPAGPRFGPAELRAVELLRDAEQALGAEDLVLERFALIEQHTRALARAEVEHFFSRVLGGASPEQVFGLLEGGREVIGRYMALARARHLRREVDAILPALERDRDARPREPFYLALDPEARRTTGVEEEQERLRAARRAHPGRARAHFAALRQAALTGNADLTLELLDGAPPRVRSSLEARLERADALMQLERWDAAFEALEALRTERETPNPRLEALWGAVVLVRIRERFGSMESSHELVSLLARAFAALDAARAAPTDRLLDVARVRLLLGRVGAAAPDFLAQRPHARADLARASAALDALEARGPEALADDPELRPLAFGGLAWLRLNVAYFAEQVR